MKKILLLSVLMSLFISNTYAGIIDFGIKAGLSSQSLNMTSSTLGDYQLSTSSKLGYQVGIISRLNLVILNVQPEILYSMNSYTMAIDNGVERTSSKIKLNTFEIPVILGIRLFMLRINAGPVFNISTSTKVADTNSGINEVFTTKPSVGYMAGLGLDLFKFNLDLRYNGQFQKTTQDIQIGSLDAQQFSTKINSIVFSVGYLF